MIYSAAEYLILPEAVPKALVLARLLGKGYPVPPLLVIVAEQDWSVVAEHVRSQLPARHYAVRFAAGNEDTVRVSNAGRYVTKLNVAGANLEQALSEVVEKSMVKLPPGTSYVVIVQEYITAEFSGVAFTRQPQGGTAWLIEYATGAGGVVGGGTVTSVTGGSATDITRLPVALQKLVTLLAKIEKEFSWPQDIEWCSVGDEIFILQSRPITSIDEQAWVTIKYLSTEFLDRQNYHYGSGSGLETYQYPRPLDYSLLRFLYSKNNAVADAYARIGVHYAPTDQFKQLGNRLYIDAEKEQQAIFPAYRMRKPDDYHIVWRPLNDVWQTAYNQARLSRAIPSTLIESTLYDLCTLLSLLAPTTQSLARALEVLKYQYATIFLGNYLVRREEFINSVSLVPTLLSSLAERYEQLPSDLFGGVTVGNSIALDDTSLFVVTPERDFRQSSLVDVVRELTRWQSVRLRKMLVDTIHAHGRSLSIPEALIPFTTLTELIKNDVSHEVLSQRKILYDRQEELQLPEVVSSWVNKASEEVITISPGEASGVLLVPKDLATSREDAEEVILFVDTLTPDCVQYFDRVVGVVCRSGGVLSHAAIVAREQKIPVLKSVIINIDYLGKRVKITEGGLTLVC